MTKIYLVSWRVDEWVTWNLTTFNLIVSMLGDFPSFQSSDENQTFIQKLEVQHQENFDRTKNNIPLEILNITFPVYLSFQRNIFLIQLKFFLKLANMTKLSLWFLSNSQPLKYLSHKLRSISYFHTLFGCFLYFLRIHI